MITGLSSSVSSLQAHDRKMTVNADNIANLNTNGYKRNQAVLEEGGVGEVRVNLRKDLSPAPEDPLAPEDIEKLSREFSEINDELEEKEMRWLELAEMEE